ncbi:MAG: oligopeptide:H+ symporter, partial [Bacteroidota bacterium]
MENNSQKRHPKGLWFLFGTEMWERFGYYLMLGIFSLYMLDGWNNGGMGFTPEKKSDIYGTYLGLVYLTPFIGGLLADRILGYRRSIIIGGLMMAAGYFMLSLHSVSSFYIALILIILGNGFFKPNISTLVGNLYSSDDMKEKKDAGYNIFYMGINIGAFICNFVAAYMRINYGWGHAFAAAGIGMLIGVVVFLLGTKHIKHVDVVKPVQEGDMSTLRIFSLTVLPMFVFGIIGYILPGNFLGSDTNDAFIIGCLPVIAFFIYLAFTSEAKESRAIKALLAVFACVILFFAIFHQNGDALTVWAEEFTNRNMSEKIANVAEKINMAQTVENSPIIQNEKNYNSAITFLNITQEGLPNKSKNDFNLLADCASKTVRIDKSFKYFKNIEKSSMPKLISVSINNENNNLIKKDTLLNYDDRILIGLFARTPSQQWPNALRDEKALSNLEKYTLMSIDKKKNELKKAKNKAKNKAKESQEIKNIKKDIKNLEVANHVYSFLKRNFTTKFYQVYSEVVVDGKKVTSPIDSPKEFREPSIASSKKVPNLKLYSTELYQSINPFWVVALTPIVVGFFGWMRRKKKEPSTPTKIAIGLVITALSALVMVGAVYATNGLSAKASSMWLIASYGVITIGELC